MLPRSRAATPTCRRWGNVLILLLRLYRPIEGKFGNSLSWLTETIFPIGTNISLLLKMGTITRTEEPPRKRRRRAPKASKTPQWERPRSFVTEEKQPSSLPVIDENGSVRRKRVARPSFVTKIKRKQVSTQGNVSEELEATNSELEKFVQKEKHDGVSAKSFKSTKRRQRQTSDGKITQSEDVEGMKSTIAGLASRIVASPEENVHLLKQLRELAQSTKGQCAALTILTESQLYKDIAPSYKIRLVTEKEADIKVSKDVARLRKFEETLLSRYQRFVKSCISTCRWRSGGGKETSATRDMIRVRRAACKALAELIRALPHFNEAHAIATTVCALTMDREEEIRKQSANSLHEVLSNAHRASGSTLDVCVLIAKTLASSAVGKVRAAPEEVVVPLTSIQFSGFPRLPTSDKKKNEPVKSKRFKKKRRRKPEKEDGVDEAELERDLREGDAEATPQELYNARKSLLNSVCHAYFNIIRAASLSAEAVEPGSNEGRLRQRKSPPALSPALKGLLRISTYISTDVIEAIMGALAPLLEEGKLPLAVRFRCLSAAYAVLGMHSRAQKADPDSFTGDARAMDSSLYSALGALYGMDTPPKDAEYITFDALESVMAARSFRQIPSVRCAALSRRLAILAAGSAPSHACSVGLIHAAKLLMSPSLVSCIYKQKGEEFEGGDARGGAGLIQKLNLDTNDPEISSAERSASWELASLAAHFHPSVRNAAVTCSTGACGSALPNTEENVILTAKSHSSAQGGFNPPPVESFINKKSRKGRRTENLSSNEVLAQCIPNLDDRMKLICEEPVEASFFTEQFNISTN